MSRNATITVFFAGEFKDPSHASKRYRVEVPADLSTDKAKLAWAHEYVTGKAYVRTVREFELALDEAPKAQPKAAAKPRKTPVAPSAPVAAPEPVRITQTRAERKASKARKTASDRKDPRLAIHEQRMAHPVYAAKYAAEIKAGAGHVAALMRAYNAMRDDAIAQGTKAVKSPRKARKAA